MQISEAKEKLVKLIESEFFSDQIALAIKLIIQNSDSVESATGGQQTTLRNRSNKRWSKEEETQVVDAFLHGQTIDSIALERQRSCNAILQRLLLTGLITLDQPIQFRNQRNQQPEVTPIETELREPTVLPGRICTKCGNRINPARLSAQPNTYRCLGCQKDFENRFGFGLTEQFGVYL
jgi:hypothetical protein